MGLDEAVETIAGILLVLGGLPFLMARLERTLDDDKPPRRHWWRRAAGARPFRRTGA